MIKILVVDDSETQRSVYKDILSEKGYVVVEARDGMEGIRKTRSELPDVIITDISMPNMGGLEMVGILKKEEATKYIPVICSSATYQDIQTKMMALRESGAEEYFYRSQTNEELILKVEVMLRIRKVYLDLLEKNKQLKQINNLVVERELKMIELKNKIKALEEELKQCKGQK